MDPIIINKTDDTPSIHFDKATGKFELSGKSLPEDVRTFYAPVFSWIEEYSKAPNAESIFVFNMVYFNTASSKIILDILLRLEEIHNAGKKIAIAWKFDSDDEDMKEAGEEYSEIVEIPFQFLEN